MNFYDEIADLIDSGVVQTKKDLERMKKKLCKKYKMKKIPTNAEILEKIGHKEVLVTKPVRSLSGVSVVAIMTKPYECPGRCIYCPTGKAAKSYTGYEPAALRARQMGFDAYKQVRNRIRQLSDVGHPTDKIELIVMGGTFTSMPLSYQKAFVLSAFNALNNKKSRTIEKAHELNEKAKHRCVGLTFELRPDFCKREHINTILGYGATRVELGVQTIYDDIYKKIKRGHTVADVIESTQLLKDSALKVCYHMMPGLPYSNRKKDLRMFREIFRKQEFKPDMIKIYPCLLAKREFSTDEIYELYESGRWKPLSNEEAASLISEARTYFPEWVRVMRIQRDIPKQYIEAGVTAGNLREMLTGSCKCIRCREVRGKKWKNPQMKVTSYKASKGKEYFIQFVDDENTLYGFLRLRMPYKPFREELEDSALIRELHVYGKEATIGKTGEIQHRGLGKKLVEEAEHIAKERYDNIVVISGVGVRPYYRKLGYSRSGPYMKKKLTK